MNSQIKHTTMRGLVDNSTVAYQKASAPEGEIAGRLTRLEMYLQEIQNTVNETAIRLVAVLAPVQSGSSEGNDEPAVVLSPLADRLETMLQSARIVLESLQNVTKRINI